MHLNHISRSFLLRLRSRLDEAYRDLRRISGGFRPISGLVPGSGFQPEIGIIQIDKGIRPPELRFGTSGTLRYVQCNGQYSILNNVSELDEEQTQRIEDSACELLGSPSPVPREGGVHAHGCAQHGTVPPE